jgi:hypothetical protein
MSEVDADNIAATPTTTTPTNRHLGTLLFHTTNLNDLRVSMAI